MKGTKLAEIVSKFHDGLKKNPDAAQKREQKLKTFYEEKVKAKKWGYSNHDNI